LEKPKNGVKMFENNKDTNEGSVLAQIAEQYSEYRKRAGIGRKSYPLELQKLALSAVEFGCAVAAVSKAAGVSTHSIYVWRSREKSRSGLKPAKRLKLTSDSAERNVGDGYARIRLRSGISVELPCFALTGEMFTLLSEVGP
jgi:transposase-like protein